MSGGRVPRAPTLGAKVARMLTTLFTYQWNSGGAFDNAPFIKPRVGNCLKAVCSVP